MERLSHLVSPITGVVEGLTRTTEAGAELVPVYIAGRNTAKATDDLYVLRNNFRGRSGGKGTTDAQARASALCEAVERHCGVFQGDEPRRRATPGELGEAGVHPNGSMLFSDAQYDARDAWNVRQGKNYQWVPRRFDPAAPVEWSPLWSLRDGDWKHLPTALCYYGYPLSADERFGWADSNGCAAGNTREEAILQGFLELVERDAVAIWWYNRLPRPAVELESLGDPYLADLRGYYRSLGRDLWLLDLTADLGVPVFAAVSQRTAPHPADLILGFGAHLDPAIAAQRAVTEANQFLPVVLPRHASPPGAYRTDDEEALDWLTGSTLENRPYLAPCPGAPPRRAADFPHAATGDIADDVRRLVGLAAARGMEHAGAGPEPARHRPGGGEGGGARAAALLGALRPRAALRRSRAAGLARRPAPRVPAQPRPGVLLAMALLHSLDPAVRVTEGPGGASALHRPGASLAPPADPGTAAALGRLATGPAAEEELVSTAREAGGALADVYYHLRAWTAHGWLGYTVADGPRVLATARCVAPLVELSPAPAAAGRALRLSRFALLRAEGGHAWLESPRSPLRVCLDDPAAAAAVLGLARPATPEAVARHVGAGVDAAMDLLGLLRAAALVVEAEEGQPSPEDHDPALAHWEFHDLLFHARSRLGRQAGGFGGTYRLEGRFPPLPAVRPHPAGPAIALPRPDLERLMREDVPFTRVLEERRSIRDAGARVITLAEVGELLFRAARVRRVYPTDHGELSSRPYPGGGACHELELYLAVGACEGVEPGLYHYCPADHSLIKVAGGDPAATRGLLRDSRIVARGAPPAQVLVVLAARFQRVSWKYESMAYALVLKDAGVLVQTLYLVATAMGLAACALGGGNADLFARAAGTDYYAETSVAELRLGAAP